MCRLPAASAILENVQFSLKACWDLELLFGYYIASLCNPFLLLSLGGGGEAHNYVDSLEGFTVTCSTSPSLCVSYLPTRSAVCNMRGSK